jgi:phosphotransferase system HPr (HPr) family protein
VVSGRVKVKNKNGIHLRLAGELVKAATMFRSEVTVTKDSQEVDAKSILGVAGLGAEYGAELVIKANGTDEGEALAYLVNLVDNEFARESN